MQSVLNEGEFFDAFNAMLKTVNKITNRTSDGKNKNAYYLGGSISRYTKNLVMSFPVLVDDSLSLDTAQMVSKANEKNIATMLEMLFASMCINGKNGTNGRDVLKQFHSNIDTMSMDDVIDAANDWVASHENAYTPVLSEATIRDCKREMLESLKMPKKSFPVNSFNENSIGDYMCRDTYNGTMVYEHKVVTEAPIPDYGYGDFANVDKDQYGMYANHRDYKDRAERDIRDFNYRRDQDINKNSKDIRDFNYRVDQDKLKNDREDRRDARSIAGDRYQQYKDSIGLNQRRIVDGDFKKANELQPTMMIVNFNVVSDDGNALVDRRSFVAGVKCRMIPAGSIDISERLLSVNKTQINFKNLIRANTGEIKLARDFIFAIDQQKLDAKNDVKKGESAKLWSTLKKRSIANNVRKISRDRNDATAITTLVVSQDTINYMISINNFDINVPKNAKMIMDNYNLLCLVIADEANEVAKFLYDGNTDFETLSYSVLEREQNDREYKKAVNMLMKER